jgi:NAD(P)H-nitrite reductase large subunit
MERRRTLSVCRPSNLIKGCQMHVVIIGNGITGITAARYLRKLSDHRITVVSDETDHFYARTALMYIYMGHLTYEQTKPYEDWFWAKNRIELRRGFVSRIDVAGHRLHFAGGGELRYDRLLIATGSKPNLFDWPGQDLDGVQGLYGVQHLDLMEQNTRGIARAVVVGGGLIGVEMAEMLHARHIPVAFLVREAGYMDYLLPAEESALVEREIRRHGIDLRLGTGLKEILPDASGRARAVVTSDGEEIACPFVGITAGVHPNTDVAAASGIDVHRGILVDLYFRSSAPHVYAAGDCAEFREPLPGRNAVEQLWYTGRIHGRTAALNILEQPVPYDPGVFFNSAKFFDVEYQTYGAVQAQLPDDQATLYWEHPAGNRAIRINYRKPEGAVVGFNLFGVRYRQQVCAHWISEGTPVTTVLQNLGAANFDPEFFDQFEASVVARYNEQQPGKHLALKRKRGLFRVS